MRLLLLSVLSVGLAACVGDSEPIQQRGLRPTTSHPDSLLAQLDADALTGALTTLLRQGYTARISVLETDSDSSVRRYEDVIEANIRFIRVVESSNPDSLATRAAPARAFDTVARLLPKEPPFRNPATREMYALSQGPTRGSVAQATAERREGTDPITRAEVAVDTTTGQVVSAHVWRESRSAVFDETSEATILLSRHNDAWVPTYGKLITDIEMPLSDSPHRQLEWRVLSIGGTELAADTSSAN